MALDVLVFITSWGKSSDHEMSSVLLSGHLSSSQNNLIIQCDVTKLESSNRGGLETGASGSDKSS